MRMSGAVGTPWWRFGRAVAVLALASCLPGWAYDSGRLDAPETSPREPPSIRRAPDGPPPLDLDRAPNGPPAGPAPLDASRPTMGRWGAYTVAAQLSVRLALISGSDTLRGAHFHVDAALWVDSKGHVTRAVLTKPSGDAAVDAALRDQVLPGVTLPEPPRDMPMPIHINFGIGYSTN
jgi:protein TonB